MGYIIKQISFDNDKTWWKPMNMDDIESSVIESDIIGGKMSNDLFRELSTIEQIILKEKL